MRNWVGGRPAERTGAAKFRTTFSQRMTRRKDCCRPEIIRAQPIGLSAAPRVTGQARGEGGKDGRSLGQAAALLFVPPNCSALKRIQKRLRRARCKKRMLQQKVRAQ